MSLKTPYKIVETLHANASTVMQKAQDANDSKHLILKIFKPAKDFFSEAKVLSQDLVQSLHSCFIKGSK